VTVLIGANDACRPLAGRMTSVAAFRTRFTAAMRVLRRASPATEVYVASVPDLFRLWSVGRTDPLERQIWKLGVCPSMLADAMGVSATDVARRGAVRDRVAAYNQALASVCGSFPRCRYDGGAVYRQAFSTAELSRWDWFHPSAGGQAALARLAYAGVTRVAGRAVTAQGM
jgi:lysophospholipase L1-like esterase